MAVRAGVTQWGPVSDCVGEVVVRVTLVTDHLDSHSSHTHYCNPGFPSHCGSGTIHFKWFRMALQMCFVAGGGQKSTVL